MGQPDSDGYIGSVDSGLNLLPHHDDRYRGDSASIHSALRIPTDTWCLFP
jgi:hypothetical protein